MGNKAGRLLIVALICLSCASCALARRLVDRHALRDVGMDLERAVVVLEQRGYQFSQNSFTANEQGFFNQQGMSPQKLTCHRQVSSLLCVESDFVDRLLARRQGGQRSCADGSDLYLALKDRFTKRLAVDAGFLGVKPDSR